MLKCFEPIKIGKITIPNRFMRSATNSGLCMEDGRPKDELLNSMKILAEGQIGLIVAGAFSVSPDEKIPLPGMYDELHARCWKRTIDTIHTHYKSKIIMQIAAIKELQNDAVEHFSNAAQLVSETGADGVQIHICHGSFLSRIIKRDTQQVLSIIKNTRKFIGSSKILSVKMNGSDCVTGGVSIGDCVSYIKLFKPYVDLFEITCQNGVIPHSIRADFSKDVLEPILSKEKITELESLQKGVQFYEGYNEKYAKEVRKRVPGVRLSAPGGWRSIDKMEDALKRGTIDLISLSRPFIRDPFLVARFKAQTVSKSACWSCNSCFYDQTFNNKPLFCHHK